MIKRPRDLAKAWLLAVALFSLGDAFLTFVWPGRAVPEGGTLASHVIVHVLLSGLFKGSIAVGVVVWVGPGPLRWQREPAPDARCGDSKAE